MCCSTGGGILNETQAIVVFYCFIYQTEAVMIPHCHMHVLITSKMYGKVSDFNVSGMVQCVTLLCYSTSVPGLIVSSRYCLCGAIHVLFVFQWVSFCFL